MNIGDDKDTPIVVFRLLMPRPELWTVAGMLLGNEDGRLLAAVETLGSWPTADGTDTLDTTTGEGWETDCARGVDMDMDDDVESDIDATEDESLERSDSRLPS